MKKEKKRSLSKASFRASKRKAFSFGDKMTSSRFERATIIRRLLLIVMNAVDIDWKLLRRFYESMLLLKLLDSVRDQRVDRSIDSEHDALSSTEIRRVFVNKLAYLCDFKKEKNTSTAIALQNSSQSVVIHCAANDHVKPRVKDFIRETLKLLITVDDTNHVKVEALIFKKAISLSRNRLRTYWKRANEMIRKCSKHLQCKTPSSSFTEMIAEESTDSGTALKLCSWLNELQRTAESMSSLMRKCYQARNSRLLRALDRLFAEGKSHCRAFQDLRHYIERLEAHRMTTKTLMMTVVEISEFLEEFSIQVKSSSPRAYCNLLPENTIASDIMGRMCSKNDAASYRDVLKLMNFSYELNLNVALEENCAFETRIHAELLLLDLFIRKKHEFTGEDRYIECSKPACYFCSQYFRAQITSFTLPACHNKLYLRWWSSDIFDELDLEAIQRRNDTMNNMNVRIREEIKEQLDRRTLTRHRQFDSITDRSIAFDIEMFQNHSNDEHFDFNLSTRESFVKNLKNASEQRWESSKESLEKSYDDSDEGVFIT